MCPAPEALGVVTRVALAFPLGVEHVSVPVIDDVFDVCALGEAQGAAGALVVTALTLAAVVAALLTFTTVGLLA